MLKKSSNESNKLFASSHILTAKITTE